MQNVDQQVNQQQNTVYLEQQIYASPKNFTPTLLVMLETFRRSEQEWMNQLTKSMRNILQEARAHMLDTRCVKCNIERERAVRLLRLHE